MTPEELAHLIAHLDDMVDHENDAGITDGWMLLQLLRLMDATSLSASDCLRLTYADISDDFDENRIEVWVGEGEKRRRIQADIDAVGVFETLRRTPGHRYPVDIAAQILRERREIILPDQFLFLPQYSRDEAASRMEGMFYHLIELGGTCALGWDRHTLASVVSASIIRRFETTPLAQLAKATGATQDQLCEFLP